MREWSLAIKIVFEREVFVLTRERLMDVETCTMCTMISTIIYSIFVFKL